MKHETVLVLDFGGQYNELIARRVRDLGVYCEVHPYKKALEKIKELCPIGIIFTGGPNSVYEEGAPKVDPAVFEQGLPILGLCYGLQMMSQVLGGEVKSAPTREFGKTPVHYDTESLLFKGMPQEAICWMSHVDYVSRLPEGFTAICHTAATANAGIQCKEKNLYGVQFHPEVEHTQFGNDILKNFLYEICHAKGDWSMKDYARSTVEALREKIGDGKVLLALSGGVDSSVAAALLDRAVGDKLTCIFVDHGLMRKNEGDEVEAAFAGRGMKFIRVNAEERFLGRLAGVTEPERKRKIIGEEFIRVFEAEAKKIGKVDFLAQGTIYPDVVESGLGGESTVVKSHHNVGGLPDCVDFEEIIEPLRRLFKDEVRQLGIALGLPESLVWRQPFPGPGLAIRIIGEITREKLDILRKADAIFREEMALAGLDRTANQYFAALTNMRSVGIMGDERTYDYAIALRSVQTQDFMTATWSRLPYELLDKVSGRIVGEVPHINRVLYDVTSKPPATVEFE